MTVKTLRIVMVLVLVLLGAGLLAYGVSFHAAAIDGQTGADGTAVMQREPNLIKEVTVGGLERDTSGEIKKTYTGEQAPAACPT